MWSDFSEYLDYKNCICKKRLVDKSADECDENIDEELEILDKNKDKCDDSCILYIVSFSIFFTINIGIGAHFVYYKHTNRNKRNVSKCYDYAYHV